MLTKLKILLITSLLNVFAYAFWGPLFTVYAVSLDANPSLAGSLFAFYAFTHASAILFFGRYDRPATRLIKITVGYIIQGLCAVMFMVISNPYFLLFPLFLSATAGGMIAPAWKALYTKALTADKEGAQWSYFDAGIYFTISLGTFLAGLIANMYGYKAIFIPLFFINICSAFLLFQNRKLLK